MKHILGFIGLSLFFLISCADQLDLKPENSLTFNNAFENEKDIVAGINRVEEIIRGNISIANYTPTVERGCYADEVSASRALVRELSSATIPQLPWNTHYQAINQANIVLPYVDQIPMTKERKDWYKGRIAFYKALVYFDMIRRWGDCVLIKEEIVIDPMAKSSWVEIADYALEQAKLAAKLLPPFDKAVDENGNTMKFKSTPCQGAANALLAHLAAWKAGGKYFAQPQDQNYNENELWELAEDACTEIIKSPLYRLANDPEEVCTSVLVGNSSESIYETEIRTYFSELGMLVEGGYFVLGGMYETYPVKPGSSLASVQYSDFKIKASSMKKMFPGDDLRRQAYFYKLDSLSHDSLDYKTGGYAYVYKWRPIVTYTEGWNIGKFKSFHVNRIWWRLSDIILLRAECRARLNKPEAIDDLNSVRERAHAPAYSASEYDGDLRYAIFKEREKELLLEGHRYFDIIRNGYANLELEGGFRTATQQDFIDGAFFFCTPLEAFTRNPLMRQNTYWFKFM